MLTALRPRLVFDVDNVTPASVERNDERVTVCFILLGPLCIIAIIILSPLHLMTQRDDGAYHHVFRSVFQLAMLTFLRMNHTLDFANAACVSFDGACVVWFLLAIIYLLFVVCLFVHFL